MRGGGCEGSGGVGVVGRCSSIRNRIVGGTTRPAVDGLAATGAGTCTSGGGASARGGSTGSGAGAGSTATGAGGGSSGIDSGGGGGGGSTAAGGGSSATGEGAVGMAGFTVLTRRGGGSTGATGFGGSGAFLADAGFLAPPFCTGVSAKMSPVGRTMLRCLASRSTNWRATTSSIVLDALFTSMP